MAGSVFGAFADRGFWSFRVVHALTGALIAVLGAATTLFINSVIKGDVASLDGRIATANERYRAIDQALFQFRFAQTNALTFGVLSANDSLRPEFRKSMVDLMFVTRTLPGVIMIQEIHFDDPKGFADERKAYLDLIEAAKQATKQEDWDAVSTFEFAHEARLFDIQQGLLGTISTLESDKRDKSATLESAVFAGFALQQLGFILVLLAGLLYQHRQGAPLPPIDPKAPTAVPVPH